MGFCGVSHQKRHSHRSVSLWTSFLSTTFVFRRLSASSGADPCHMPFDRPMTYASARAAGATDWELRHPPWNHSFHGVVSLQQDDGDPDLRVAAVIPLMTKRSVLTGWAAARLQAVTMMDGRDRFYREMPITIASPDRGQHRPQPGLLTTRRSIQPQEFFVHDSVNVATIARAAYDCALDAPSLQEAIVAIDMCTSTVIGQSRTTVENIRRLSERHTKTRGIVQARRAIELASSRSASPWESRTRYVAEVKAGIVGLKANIPVFDFDGRLAGVADLLDEESGLVIESDGAGHREELAHAEDNVREEGLERLGLFVSRVSSADHKNESALVDRLAAGRLHARMIANPRGWTLEKPDWWWRWAPGRRWD